MKLKEVLEVLDTPGPLHRNINPTPSCLLGFLCLLACLCHPDPPLV